MDSWTAPQKSWGSSSHILKSTPSISYICCIRYSQTCPHLCHPPYLHHRQLLAPLHRLPATSESWTHPQILRIPSARRLPPFRIDNPNTISTLSSINSNLIDPITHPQQWNLTGSLFQRHISIRAQNHAKMAKCGRNLLWTFRFRVGQRLISPFVDRRKGNFPFAITTLYTTSIIMLAGCSSILVMLAFGRLIPRPIGNIGHFQSPLNLGPHTISMVVW